MKEYDVKSLPKWAQDRIATLEDNAKYYQDKAYEAAGIGGKETNTLVDAGYQDERGLPSNTTILFKTGGGDIEVWIDKEDNNLRVRLRGSASLHIQPILSNTFTVIAGGKR